jgi:AraC family transcriptional regulator
MKPDTENIYQRKINQVIDYINANLHLPLRLDIIAGQVNVSERQLLRIMKGALNESLYAYVARQRVERAVLYMHTEDMSLADLASRVGYDSPQSFSKAFKKQFSVSPKAYMDKLRARLREETEKWSNASVGKEIIPSGMFGTIRLQKGKYAVYTLKGRYAGLQELYKPVGGINLVHT